MFSLGFLGPGDPLIMDMELDVDEDLTLLAVIEPSLELVDAEPCLGFLAAVVCGSGARQKPS